MSLAIVVVPSSNKGKLNTVNCPLFKTKYEDWEFMQKFRLVKKPLQNLKSPWCSSFPHMKFLWFQAYLLLLASPISPGYCSTLIWLQSFDSPNIRCRYIACIEWSVCFPPVSLPKDKLSLLYAKTTLAKSVNFRIVAHGAVHKLFENFLSSWKDIPHHCSYYVQCNSDLKHTVPRSWKLK